MFERDGQVEQVAETQRVTKADARGGGIGTPEAGAELAAGSSGDEAPVLDLGADESVVAAAATHDRGPRQGADPTDTSGGEPGMGDGDQEVRQTLEDRFPRTTGHWKEAGRMPEPEPGPNAPTAPPERPGAAPEAAQPPQSDGEEPTCAECGGQIRSDDVTCPHCGAALVAG